MSDCTCEVYGDDYMCPIHGDGGSGTPPGIPEARHPKQLTNPSTLAGNVNNPAGLDFEKAEKDAYAEVIARSSDFAFSHYAEKEQAREDAYRALINAQFLAALQQREAEVTARVKRETKEWIVSALRDNGDHDLAGGFCDAADFISTLENDQ